MQSLSSSGYSDRVLGYADLISDDTKWLARRMAGIGASEAGAALGVSPWKDPLELYLEKLRPPPKPDKGVDSGPRAWGNRLELPILQWYAETTGHTVYTAQELCFRLDPETQCPMTDDFQRLLNAIEEHAEVDFIGGGKIIFRSKLWPALIYSPDALLWDHSVDEPGTVDAKLTGESDRRGWKDQTPPDVLAQLVHSMCVMGCSFAQVAVLFGDCQSGTRNHDRNEADIRAHVDGVNDFWRRLCEGRPPAVRGSKSDARALRSMVPREADGLRIVLPLEAEGVAEDFLLHSRQLRAHSKKREIARVKLMGMMGIAEYGECADGTVVRMRTSADGKRRVHVKPGDDGSLDGWQDPTI